MMREIRIGVSCAEHYSLFIINCSLIYRRLEMMKRVLLGLAVTVMVAAAGYAQSGTGSPDQAIATYTEAIRLDPNDADAYYNRGNAYGNKGDMDRAIADFDQAIRLIPNYSLAYNYRGLAYLNKGEYDRAITDFNQALRINLNYADAYLNRGVAYANKGEYVRARTDYEKALQLNPNDVNARNNLKIVTAELAAAQPKAAPPPEPEFVTSPEGSGVVINGYNGKGGAVVIPATIDGKAVVAIGGRAFDRKKLTSVVIPDSVWVIRVAAFAGNPLTSATLPADLELISQGASNPFMAAAGLSPDTGNPLPAELMYAYRSNRKKAGTYTRPSTNSDVWTVN
jgi:tetratricopeptide (TPR) repeat protein